MSVVSKLLKKAEAEPGLHYRNPSVPHACSIPGGLCIGSKIYIHGVLPKSAKQFSIRLQRGADAEHSDIQLHLLAKVVRPGLLLRNSRSGGLWGVEEQVADSLSLPVEPRAFLLTITAYVDVYEIEVNGSAQWSVKVRDGLPISAVTHLAIEAELSIRAIHIPVENMPRKLRLSLGDGVKVGDMVSIKGQPTEDAKSFTVNWQSGPATLDDILFRLTPRLEEGRLSVGSRLDDKEEGRALQGCPFADGRPFALRVAATPRGFEAVLDGGEVAAEAEHRAPPDAARTLFIEGDLQVHDLLIDAAQLNPFGIMNGINLKSRAVRLHQTYPALPLTARITGGFEKGCILLISGIINAQPKKLELSLQCGEGPEDDVALRYTARWEADDGAPSTAALNSREEGSWGAEAALPGPLEAPLPGLPFSLHVARAEEDLVLLADGCEQGRLPYRIEDDRPDTLVVVGDAQVHRVVVL